MIMEMVIVPGQFDTYGKKAVIMCAVVMFGVKFSAVKFFLVSNHLVSNFLGVQLSYNHGDDGYAKSKL